MILLFRPVIKKGTRTYKV